MVERNVDIERFAHDLELLRPWEVYFGLSAGFRCNSGADPVHGIQGNYPDQRQ
jgi:hypothetical protein